MHNVAKKLTDAQSTIPLLRASLIVEVCNTYT